MRQRVISSLALVLLLMVAISGCQQEFRQSTVPAEDIPLAMRQKVDSTRQESRNTVWRAHYEQDGYEIAVLTYDRGDARELISHQQCEWVVFRDGAPVRPPGFSQDMSFVLSRYAQSYAPPEPFRWQPDEHLALQVKSGDNSASIWAIGYAWVEDAHEVIGTTFTGRVFEASVVNGYWILLDLDVQGAERADRFETVKVLDEDGKVLYTHTRTG